MFSRPRTLPVHESNAVGRAKASTVALALSFYLSASGAIPRGIANVPVSSTFFD